MAQYIDKCPNRVDLKSQQQIWDGNGKRKEQEDCKGSGEKWELEPNNLERICL